MSVALVLVALIGAILVVFVRTFRKRAQRTLEQAGHRIPEELLQRRTAKPVPAPLAAPGRSAASAAHAHFLLIYDLDRDFIQRRTEHWDEHLSLAWKASAAGELVLAGALEPPTEQAFLLFKGSREAAIRFAEADPYVRHGLVKHWRVKQWHTVAGESAAAPVRPK